MRDQIERVAAMRRDLPAGPTVRDYEFLDGDKRVKLSELFAPGKNELLIYHLMYWPQDDEFCPMCSMWIDGLHGVSHHLTRRAAFVVIGKAPIGKLRSWAGRRGWDGLRIVSSYGTSFNPDLNVEGPKGGQWPAVSVFVRDGDSVRHFFTESAGYPDGAEGGMDQVSPVWNVFDLLPEGRGDWLPDNIYPGRARG